LWQSSHNPEKSVNRGAFLDISSELDWQQDHPKAPDDLYIEVTRRRVTNVIGYDPELDVCECPLQPGIIPCFSDKQEMPRNSVHGNLLECDTSS
jgi:hypothetical protein